MHPLLALFLRSCGIFLVLHLLGVPPYWNYWVAIAHDAISLLILGPAAAAAAAART